MGWTKNERYLTAVIIVLIVVFAAFAWRHNAWMKKYCVCRKGDKFSGGDLDGWPTSGTFGNLADTNPYGNYADGRAMFWPTYDERNGYWTRS
jgi:hypothetical protein